MKTKTYKFTEEQLVSAYAKWITDFRLHPTKYITDGVSSTKDVKDSARDSVSKLLTYLKTTK